MKKFSNVFKKIFANFLNLYFSWIILEEILYFIKIRFANSTAGMHSDIFSCLKLQFYPNRTSIEVLHVFVICLTLFTSLYLMHVIFYVHEILLLNELSENFSMQPTKSDCSRHISIFIKFSMHISKYCMKLKFFHRGNLFIPHIFYCAP